MISYLRDSDRRDKHDSLLEAHQQINALASGASPALRPLQNAGSELRWTTPSLISSYAIMAAIDLSGGADVRRCAMCGAPFITSTGHAQYCSRTCRTSHNKRVNRERRRLAVELTRQGWEVEKIAERVGAQDIATVQRWIKEARGGKEHL